MLLRIGLIGFGDIAQKVHVRLLTTMRDVALIGIADVDPVRREQANQRVPTAKIFADYAELLALRDLDAVVICLPTAQHAPATIAALNRHKHIYLEKPLAAYLSEAREILDAWQAANVVGVIGFNYRFNPLYLSAKKFIDSGKLGPVTHVRTIFSTQGQKFSEWRQRRSSGGGVLLEMASHHIDLIRFLFAEEIVEVFARTWSVHGEEDNSAVQMRLENGAIVQSYFSLTGAEEDRVEIYCERGKLNVERYLSLTVEPSSLSAASARMKKVWHAVHVLAHAPYILQKLSAPLHEPSYSRALANFTAAARGEAYASPDFVEGYESLRVIIAAEQSARSGRAVVVRENG